MGEASKSDLMRSCGRKQIKLIPAAGGDEA